MSRSRARVGMSANVATLADTVHRFQPGDALTGVVQRCERERLRESQSQRNHEYGPNPVFHVKPFLPRRSETAGQLLLTSGFDDSV